MSGILFGGVQLSRRKITLKEGQVDITHTLHPTSLYSGLSLSAIPDKTKKPLHGTHDIDNLGDRED
jgi:hypothetical protein